MAIKPVGFPSLQSGQCALLQVEAATGYVLNPTTGAWWTEEGSGAYTVFSSIEQARRYATSKVQGQPQIECNLFDAEANLLDRIIHRT